ncbi:MAG: hypothetical protein U5K56_13030 [Halioglobus sp.]|nr:hypothetical protein [Halioglobus sp.]
MDIAAILYALRKRVDKIRTIEYSEGTRCQSALIREAIDALVADAELSNWKSGMMAAAGLWANRSDLPDFARLRTELDRFGQSEG